MDNGTKARTTARALTTSGVVIAVWCFVYPKIYEVTQSMIAASIVATIISIAIITVDAWTTYMNNDYTEIAAEYTAEMRQRKLEETDGYVGERFYDDMYPEEEDEDEQ